MVFGMLPLNLLLTLVLEWVDERDFAVELTSSCQGVGNINCVRFEILVVKLLYLGV